MKLNVKIRLKNPWFWVGIVSTILAAMGVDPEMFTSWDAVWSAFVSLVSNPFQLGCVILAVLGIFIDPTTSGVTDSAQVMKYARPNKNK